MTDEQLTQREAAYRRIEQRRKKAALRRKKQKQRRMIALILLIALLISLAACRVLKKDDKEPSQDSPSSAEETGGDITPGGDGTDINLPIDEPENYDHVDITPKSDDSPLMLELKNLAVDYPRVKKIIDNVELYSEELLTLALKNQEALDFVADYPEKGNRHPEIDLSKEAAQTTMPLLLQWDERWGYEEYGSGLIGWTGCGPTCMSMLTLYLTGNADWDPASVARWAEDNGYYSGGAGTAWTFMAEGSAHFGLRAEEMPLVKKYMVDAVNGGRPIVCAMAPGDFTTGGHYIILTSYDEEQGFSVNDPNSPMRSQQYWTYERLEPQISNLWAFSKS